MPSAYRPPRGWRTRNDPFEDVWNRDVAPLLVNDKDGALQGTTVMQVLEERYPGRFQAGQLRTLQRRIRDWRAEGGPDREVFFEQEHPPGREGQLDFTHGTELGVTIGGVLFTHLLFEYVLCFSGWRWVCLAFGETFEALSAGIQGAVWALGATAHVWRSDNLSAATHQLRQDGGGRLTVRYQQLLDHYGTRSTRIRPGKSNENGVVEKAHDVLKTAIEQALIVRQSRDFVSIEDYMGFVQGVVDRLNRKCESLLVLERPHLKSLPSAPIPAYTEVRTTVRKWSCIRVGNRSYSVPSRLIGYEVTARLHPDEVEVFYRGKRVDCFPRLRGKDTCRIDYRHIIHSLVRKPGAFARYRYREALFPSLTFRQAYDALRERHGDRADLEYLRILHLAAMTMECDVEAALQALLEAATPFESEDVKALVAPGPKPAVAIVAPFVPNLGRLDGLLTGVCNANLRQATTAVSAC